jgi:protein-disulfide isomerase
MKRRAFLASSLALGSIGLAGCLGDGDSDSDPTTETTTGTTNSVTETSSGLPDHAALDGLDAQPYLGPPPGEASALIVAFEDPSCPSCRRFEQDTMPDIRSELTSTGKGTVVVRGYPVIYPWGEPATRVLEGTYAADEDAFWALWEHYFAAQTDYRNAGREEVFPRTERFLAEQTDLDAAGIVESARAGDFEAAVQTDLDAGKAAGAGGTTPHLFIFKDGEYQTKAQGLVTYQLIESTLDL